RHRAELGHVVLRQNRNVNTNSPMQGSRKERVATVEIWGSGRTHSRALGRPAGVGRGSALRLRQGVHFAERGLDRRDGLAIVEGLGEPRDRLRGFRSRLYGRVGKRRCEYAADAEPLEDLDRGVDAVTLAGEID